jgi:hypothetical protein
VTHNKKEDNFLKRFFFGGEENHANIEERKEKWEEGKFSSVTQTSCKIQTVLSTSYLAILAANNINCK